MFETPGLARNLASVTDDDDDDAPIGEASARYFDGAAERARLIARGVLRPADGRDRRTEWITRGQPCFTLTKGSP